MECKHALVEAKGDVDKAVSILKEKGWAKAEKKASRKTGQGLIASYVHQERVGVLLELACETDFVAKCDPLQRLAKDLTLQIASMAPRFIDRRQVPQADLEKAKASSSAEGGSVDQKMEEWYSRNCLLEQPFIKDAASRVRDILVQAVAKIGENILVKRFVRFEVGEAPEA